MSEQINPPLRKLFVSIPTFNEIAGLLKNYGVSYEGQQLTLARGEFLVPPVDYRLVQVRKDCLIEAVKVFNSDYPESLLDTANNMYNFVLNGELPKPKQQTTEWTKEQNQIKNKLIKEME